MCFGAQENGSFEYPQHMFWLRNKKIIFSYTLLSGGLSVMKYQPGPILPCQEIDHEIISTVILTLLLPLLQGGLLSVTSESMCTKYWLVKLALGQV